MNWTLITGASSGIGEATAELLATKKHNLWLTARRGEKLKTLAQKLKTEVRCTTLDVSKEDEVAAFSKEKDLAAVDILINNAGLAKGRAPIQEVTAAQWEEMIQTNIMGLLRTTHAVLPHMVKAKRGHIVNLGSAAARWAYPGGNVYAATKSAVHMLSQSMRIDLMGLGIRVSEISPGMVETNFSAVRFGDEKLAKEVYKNMTPLNAKDVAETIAWCLDRPPHVNIQEIVMYPTEQASTSMVHRRS